MNLQLAAACMLSLTVFGCSSSKITSSWKADAVSVSKTTKILVLGLVKDSDRSMKENMENHLAADLRELGYNAFSSIKEYGPKAFEKMDELGAINELRVKAVDMVLTIVLLDKRREKKYIPGNVYYTPYSYYQNHFWRYYGTLNHRIYEPGYYVVDTKLFWESNLYDISTQKLLYSVQTQSFDSDNLEKQGHEYGRMIIKDMVSQKVLN